MLWIDAVNSRRMLAGADQGPTISVDSGETWSPWYNMIDGQFYRVVDRQRFSLSRLRAATGLGHGVRAEPQRLRRDPAERLGPAGGFENGFIVADPLNPRWLYTQGWYHVLRRFDRVTSQVSVFYTPTPRRSLRRRAAAGVLAAGSAHAVHGGAVPDGVERQCDDVAHDLARPDRARAHRRTPRCRSAHRADRGRRHDLGAGAVASDGRA